DATREGGAFGDDRENRPERCPRDRPIAADGLVSAGSCKIGGVAGYPRRTRRAQAPAGEAARRRAQYPWDPARLWTEGRRGQPRQVRGPYPGTDRRARHPGDGDRCDAGGTGSVVAGVHQAPPGDAEDRARRQDLPSVDEHTWRRRAGRPDLSIGGGRSDPLWKIEYGRCLFLADPQEISVRRDQPGWRCQQGRRRDGPNRALRGGAYQIGRASCRERVWRWIGVAFVRGEERLSV